MLSSVYWMMKPSQVPICLFLSLFLLGTADSLHIASFNIQIFGTTKFGNEFVVTILAQVSSRLIMWLLRIRERAAEFTVIAL